MDKWASSESTEKYFQWIEIDPTKIRKFDGLSLSAMGAGTYLGASDDSADRLYEASLLQAGLHGINCFDTAINYRCQRSEKILKKVLKELAARGVTRDQIFLSTKGGLLPSEGTPEKFDEWVRTQYLDTGVIEPQDVVGGVHCMTPAFLENQIGSSLKNVQVDCIDLYYLHNPELQLAEVTEEEFYSRICQAFALFEKKVQEKKIKRYGIATWNGFRQKKGALQLKKLVACAEKEGGAEHHFRAIQVPYNPVMLEAIKVKNQEGQKTIFEAAADLNIAIMGSAPLMQSQVMDLPKRVFEKLPPSEKPALQILEFVLSTPHLVTSYVGMKQMVHEEENMKALHTPSWTKEVWAEAAAVLGIKKGIG
ncbi:MAG: aldo/keto reductase [Verrucomicrobia bacterium]|nr:aldo/keto reductase [Verrucomicrobiota bacterium]